MKVFMVSRRQMIDEFVSESFQIVEEIKSLVFDIVKTFGLEGSDFFKQLIGKVKKERKELEEIKFIVSGIVFDDSEIQQFGFCGKFEGCGIDDEFDKRLSKEFDILLIFGSELNEGLV